MPDMMGEGEFGTTKKRKDLVYSIAHTSMFDFFHKKEAPVSLLEEATIKEEKKTQKDQEERLREKETYEREKKESEEVDEKGGLLSTS